MNPAMHKASKKKVTKLMIPSIRFTKLIILYLQQEHQFHPRRESLLHLESDEHVVGYLKFTAKGTNKEVFGMNIPETLITSDMREAPYYQEYLDKVTAHQEGIVEGQAVDAESTPTKVSKTHKSMPKKRKEASITEDAPIRIKKPSKGGKGKKQESLKRRKMIDEKDPRPFLLCKTQRMISFNMPWISVQKNMQNLWDNSPQV